MPDESDIRLYLKQVYQALEATAATVNTARQEKGLPHIEFTNTNVLITTSMSHSVVFVMLFLRVPQSHSAVKLLSTSVKLLK